MKFDGYCQTILEYFLNNLKAYYMTQDGTIHDVEYTHNDQIVTDFNLGPEIKKAFRKQYNKVLNWDRDDEWVTDYVAQFRKMRHIIFMVLDLDHKVVYVRNKQSDLNALQRNILVDFCIDKHSELEYDSKVIA